MNRSTFQKLWQTSLIALTFAAFCVGIGAGVLKQFAPEIIGHYDEDLSLEKERVRKTMGALHTRLSTPPAQVSPQEAAP